MNKPDASPIDVIVVHEAVHLAQNQSLYWSQHDQYCDGDKKAQYRSARENKRFKNFASDNEASYNQGSDGTVLQSKFAFFRLSNRYLLSHCLHPGSG